MGIKTGVLALSKKVKRIYVGVDGKARRVNKVYATRQGYSGARSVYKDTESLQFSIIGNYGGASAYLAAVIRDGVAGKYLISGTFTGAYKLSELSVPLNGLSQSFTGRSVSLGSASTPYTNLSFSNCGSLYSDIDYPVSFSGAANGHIYIKRVNLYSMSEYKKSDSDSSSFSFSSGTSSISNSAQPVDPYDYIHKTFPPLSFLSINASGNSLFAALALNGIYSKNYSVTTNYKPLTNTIMQRDTAFGYQRTCRTLVTVSTATGLSPKLTAVLAYETVSGAWIIKVVENYYIENMPSSYDNLSVGTAARIYTTISAASADSRACYVNTLSYQDSSKRYFKLIVDFGEMPSENSAGFEVVEYTESCNLPSDLSRAKYYNWHVLGAFSDELYVLSTAEDKIKILRFIVKNGTIQKDAEYDTGETISSSITLNNVIPHGFDRPRDEEISLATYMIAFMLTINNEYNKIVVVPRSLIK